MEPLRNLLRNEDCTRCELHKTAQSVCLIGDGPYPAKIMIIGEAPGHREDDINKPFSGRAGKILDVVMEECGISREEVFITNVVHCRPPENRTPSIDEMRACRKYLLREIKRVKPEIIITLGNTAIKGLLNSNLASISKERGKILDWEGIKVLPTYHPAAALRNKYYANVIFEDLKNGLHRIQEGEAGTSGKYSEFTPLMVGVLKELMEAKIVSLDVETTGLDYMDKKQELTCIGISDGPGRAYVFKPTESNLRLVQDILRTKDLLINHNIKFDLQWLHRYGIKYKGKIFDTLVAKHLLDENCPDKSLKALARIELGMTQLSEDEQIMIKCRKEKTEPKWSDLVRYNGGDCDAAFRLWKRYSKCLEKEGLTDLMKTEMKVLKTLTRMEIWGFKIDLEEHARLMKEYEEKIEESSTNIKRLVGDINLNSPKQLQKVLYEDLDLPILVQTESGGASCNEAALKMLLKIKGLDKDKKKVLQALMTYRSCEKLYSVYLAGLVKNDLIKHDGKIHCDFKITGTVTGRLSCSEPNLQNIPRDGDIKRMFVSSFNPGRIIQVDYSQMELRILAHYSEDKKLLQAFKEKRDIHRETTAKCLRIKPEEVTEDQRKVIGKRVNFGIVYLISAMGLADKLGCTTKKAQSYIENWYEEFWRAREWMKERKDEIIESGRSVSFNGRVRRLYGVDPGTSEGREAIRQGTNSCIQGGAGDITKWAMYRLDRRLAKEKMRARVNSNVHDAVMIDAPKEEVSKCIELVKEIFQVPPIPLKVPLEFEIKVGKNWNELKEVG